MGEARYCVKIMADYCADECLWSHGNNSVDWQEVREAIPPHLIEELKDWGYNYGPHVEEEPILKEEIRTFAERGLELAKSVKACLPNYRVYYYDDYRYAVLKSEPLIEILSPIKANRLVSPVGGQLASCFTHCIARGYRP